MQYLPNYCMRAFASFKVNYTIFYIKSQMVFCYRKNKIYKKFKKFLNFY